MGHLKASLVDKDAAYEFKYVIDGAFVNESSTLQMERIWSENSVLEVLKHILICYTETFLNQGWFVSF
jgi:hypothetical protein